MNMGLPRESRRLAYQHALRGFNWWTCWRVLVLTYFVFFWGGRGVQQQEGWDPPDNIDSDSSDLCSKTEVMKMDLPTMPTYIIFWGGFEDGKAAICPRFEDPGIVFFIFPGTFGGTRLYWRNPVRVRPPKFRTVLSSQGKLLHCCHTDIVTVDTMSHGRRCSTPDHPCRRIHGAA